MPAAYVVPQSVALADPTNHCFCPGVGYMYAGPPPGNPFAVTRLSVKSCFPPPGSMDGTEHVLIAPSGAKMKFKWQQGMQTWQKCGAFLHGARLSFTPRYLQDNGWTWECSA